MTNRVRLDNIEHASLRVSPSAAPEFGHSVNQLLLVPAEFEEAQREFPIFFRRDGEGRFHAVALLGFDRGENLFLDGAAWTARYMPAVLRRGPFFLGPAEEQDLESPATVYVDLDDPRVSETEGEPLFLIHGGRAPYLVQVTDALQTVHEGLAAAKVMFTLFAELGLLQPINVDVRLADGLEYHIPDLFTVSRAGIERLTGAQLESLNRGACLAAAIHVCSSTGNMNRLVSLKSAKLGRVVDA
jgi:hypothetical protein